MAGKEKYSEETVNLFGDYIQQMATLSYNSQYVKGISFRDDSDSNILTIPSCMIFTEHVRVKDMNFSNWPDTIKSPTSLYVSLEMEDLIDDVKKDLDELFVGYRLEV